MPHSGFTLTFAVELQNENNGTEKNEYNDWIELEPCTEGAKIQYNLYPGYSYDLDILIWRNACKIWCGNNYGWVRTWQLLNKRWMVFTIKHNLPARVEDFRNHEIIVTPSAGIASFSAIAKNDKNFSILIPPPGSGDLRYFAKILEKLDENIVQYITGLIWNMVISFIPATFHDENFDTPELVSDVRHQDSILCYVKEAILSSNANLNEENGELLNPKEKGKKTETESSAYKLKLSGEIILAGSGRVNRFMEVGKYLQGRVLAVISTCNLPAPDDLPIMFVNINNLMGIPYDEFNKAGFSQIYTSWKIGSTKHDSVPQTLTNSDTVLFDDHCVITIEPSTIYEIFYVVMENGFEIQLRGIREEQKLEIPSKLFNVEDKIKLAVPFNNDREEQDTLIACTRIDINELSKGSNKLIFGEFSLYPAQTELPNLKQNCTNYINGIGCLERRNYAFQPHIVLNAQMVLEVSIGLLGCKIYISKKTFSRLICFINTEQTAKKIINKINEMNQMFLMKSNKENLLTGFSIATGDTHLIFLEGEKNKDIIKLWETAETFYPDVKSYFSSSDTYLERIYPEMVNSKQPFDVLRMRVPLSTLLACPPVYVRPALPLPARSAMLKISQIIKGNLLKAPSRPEMPTATEMRSFKLELCIP